MNKFFTGRRTKRGLLLFGIGVLVFAALIAAASITVAVLNTFFNDRGFDAYTISFIALSGFALIFTVTIVALFYFEFRKAQTIIDSLNRVAEGDYTTEIQYGRRDAFSRIYLNFNKMTKELRSARNMREDFVHSFSHEIKTPLFSIQGFANLLLEGGLSEEEQKKLLRIISDEAGRLFRLADSTLILSKLESQQLLGENKPIKLDSEISDCIVLLAREWDEKNIEVSADLEPLKINGDSALLRQVWLNLLSNAVKFTPEGGKINISLKRSGNFAVAAFKDSGCGIKEEDLPHIFDKYYRSETAKPVEGNGLGLAICKRICALAGGEIAVSSKPGEGSEFTVSLPLKQ